MSSKLGILGGTFDPVHIGHLILADQARAQLGLEKVIFLPAAVPPHKMSQTITEAKRRKEMLDIAIGGNPFFQVSTIEIDRAGVSYTIDTLESLQSLHPTSELWLIVGADTIADVPNWRRPLDIVRAASFGVAGRPGFNPQSPASLGNVRVAPVEMPLLEISSSLIRRNVSEGRSIRYLVPAGVEAFIFATKLYQSKSG
jgi:nicotinate-nucleotide adenylyltransferase